MLYEEQERLGKLQETTPVNMLRSPAPQREIGLEVERAQQLHE